MPDVDLTIGPAGTPDLEDAVDPYNPFVDDDELDGLDADPDAGVEPVQLIGEEQVRLFLEGLVSNALHYSLTKSGSPARAAELWKLTARDLDELTPPFTRIVNRVPRLQGAVRRGDELYVLLYLAGWTTRNTRALAELRELEQLQDEPAQEGT